MSDCPYYLYTEIKNESANRSFDENPPMVVHNCNRKAIINGIDNPKLVPPTFCAYFGREDDCPQNPHRAH